MQLICKIRKIFLITYFDTFSMLKVSMLVKNFRTCFDFFFYIGIRVQKDESVLSVIIV